MTNLTNIESMRAELKRLNQAGKPLTEEQAKNLLTHTREGLYNAQAMDDFASIRFYSALEVKLENHLEALEYRITAGAKMLQELFPNSDAKGGTKQH